MNLPIESQIESILFWKGESVSISELSKILNTSIENITEGIKSLETSLEGRGIKIVSNGDEVTLSTHPEMSGFIEELTKAELTKDLTKAALETLSVIIYRGPITRSEVDYIRGVNSQFIIRNLLIRGLIDKIDNPKDERSFLYQPSIKLLQLLGITNQQEMPDFEKIKLDVSAFITDKKDGKDSEEK